MKSLFLPCLKMFTLYAEKKLKKKKKNTNKASFPLSIILTVENELETENRCLNK